MAIAIATTFAVASTSCGKKEHNELEHHHEAEAAEAEGHEEHEHGGGEIVIEPEIAEQYGIKTQAIEKESFSSSIHLTGEITASPSDMAYVSASTSGILTLNSNVDLGSKVAAGQSLGHIKAKTASGDDPNAVSNAQIAAAEAEVNRLKPLLDDGIVTLREYNAALSALKTAKASYSKASASGAVTAPASGTIVEVLANTGQYVDTGTPIAKLSRNQNLILKVDVPERYSSSVESGQGVSVKSDRSDEWLSLTAMGAKRISDNTMPVKAGFTPMMYSFRNDGRFAAGMTVEVDITAADAGEALVAPASAIIEQQGENYVYVKTSEHGYEKRLVKIGGRSEGKVEILSGLNAGDLLVTEGATTVKMAESSGAVPEGHSHNH